MSSLTRIIFDPDTTPPSVPVNLTAAPTSQSSIHLVWTASSDAGSGIFGYNVYRGASSSGPFAKIGSSATIAYDDTGLVGSATWFYRVTALDNAGNESSSSAIVSATTPDQTAPSVPTNLAANASQSQINLTWTASTDTGGSGLAGYRVYRNGGTTPIGTPTTPAYSDTGLSAGTLYAYRVSAVDNAGNESAQSAQASATTSASNPVWTASVSEALTQGSAASIALQGGTVASPNVVADPLGGSIVIVPAPVQQGAPTGYSQGLPPGISVTTTGLSGTPTAAGKFAYTVRALNGPDADWQSRSTAAGVLQAVRFDSQAILSPFIFNEDANKGAGWTAQHVLFDASAQMDGSAGSCRINVLDLDGLDNGNLQFYIDPVNHTIFTTGMDFFIQWRMMAPASFLYSAFLSDGSNGSPINPGFANGFKQMILSQYESNGQGGTNVSGEIVVENTEQMCCPRAYFTDPGGNDQLINTSYNGGNDARWQNAIVNASPADPSGTLVYPQASQKYGPTYSMHQAGKRNLGAPDPNNGGWIYVPDNRMTFEVHVRPGTIGSSNTVVEMWCAADGLPPVLVHRTLTANPGRATTAVYGGFTLLPYCTARTSNGGFDTNLWLNSVISGTQPIKFPGGYPVSPS